MLKALLIFLPYLPYLFLNFSRHEEKTGFAHAYPVSPSIPRAVFFRRGYSSETVKAHP